MNVMDFAGSFWITAFNEVAEQIMGISANDLMHTKVRTAPRRISNRTLTKSRRTRTRIANSIASSRKLPARRLHFR